MTTLILASASPRRREILAEAGYEFMVQPSGFDEGSVDAALHSPEELARVLSLMKARDVAEHSDDETVVLAADTFIVLGDEIMGKPHTHAEARRMLCALSGRGHQVITGFTVMAGGGFVHSESVTTKVWFKALSADEIEDYIAMGEPLDKAGAYAIQGIGEKLVDRIEGDFLNVVGLPLERVRAVLSKVLQA